MKYLILLALIFTCNSYPILPNQTDETKKEQNKKEDFLSDDEFEAKTKEELEHRWQNDDWEKQLKDYIDNQRTSSKSF